ncbi:GDSL esterase/lipase [Heracleum sosnowskyi]|uniref:GDSL esterase/lipase n=1 Tax=Heracleum sosnowskyi TaxID=360622 RepID=A0AAD8IBP6_9APIA|nr:GDSL esterase/lipase [Heracleum sosnowskyi]
MASLFESCILPFIILMVFKLQIRVISAAPQVPCYFVFGDSLVDNGNNNNLVTQAKVNYPPYGVDFPGQNATGRFTNGENTADIIGRLLGFANYTPPYATARGPDILQGVNYGSGGSGIRDETGRNLGDRVTFNEQLLRHGITKLRISALYNYEARKVAVFGLGLIGCAPAVVSKFGANASGCVDRVNAAVALFNEKLKPLVDDFNSNLTGAKFIYINTTNINLGDPIAAEVAT